MKRWNLSLVSILTVAMTLGACGGGDLSPEATPVTTAVGSSGTPDPTSTPPDSTEPDAGGGDEGASVGRVTIDGTTYEFGMNGPAVRCDPDAFGGFWAVMRTEDLTGTFGVELWPDGGDRPDNASMSVTIDGVQMDLKANPEQEPNWPAVEAGTSLVQSFQIDGNKATGTASFVDDEVAFDASLFPLDPIIGEFEVICGADS